jgi:hypothetical protein
VRMGKSYIEGAVSSLHSIGGTAHVLGGTTLRMKIGKFRSDQTFQVLAKPIAGYNV